MKVSPILWVLGGDQRQVYLAQALLRAGVQVRTYAQESTDIPLPLSQLSKADGVIFPMPVTADGAELFTPLAPQLHVSLAEALDACHPNQFLCGGRIDSAAARLAEARGLTLSDYFQREELSLANCVPTAEGAIQLAMEELPVTIHGCPVLVIGCGRVGKATAQRFAALGARVTVAARRQVQLTWARCQGCGAVALQSMRRELEHYALVINTVPAPILGEGELKALRPDCLILDLASKPGGVDRLAAQRLERKAIHALSLPGQVAPQTAGEIIAETILHMLDEFL